jgi:AcrR family transcriptional regulator
MSKIKPTKPTPNPTAAYPAGPIRERILNAAFSLFAEPGFSTTSMLDIVTRARVSKRDLCALFQNKHAVLAACIHERVALLTKAQERRLVANGDPAALATRYFALLWGDLLLSLLMRVRKAPAEREIQTRARAATETLFCRFP